MSGNIGEFKGIFDSFSSDNKDSLKRKLHEKFANASLHKILLPGKKPRIGKAEERGLISFAVINGAHSCLRYLLQANIQGLKLRDSDSYQPLHHACQRSNTIATEIILKQAVAHPEFDILEIVNSRLLTGVYENYTPIQLAVLSDSCECIKLMLEIQGIDLSVHKSCGGGNLLHGLCLQGRGETAEMLLSHGVNITDVDNDDRTVLMLAAGRDRASLFITLMNYIDKHLKIAEQVSLLQKKDKYGNNLVHYAAKTQSQKAFQFKYPLEYETYEILFRVCLAPISLSDRNEEGDAGLDMVPDDFADVLDIIHHHRKAIASAGITDLKTFLETPQSDFEFYFTAEEVPEITEAQHKCQAFINEELAEENQIQGSCPVMNYKNSTPIKCRKLKSMNFSEMVPVQYDSDSDSQSDSEEGDSEYGTSTASGSHSSSFLSDEENGSSDVDSFPHSKEDDADISETDDNAPKCPFGFKGDKTKCPFASHKTVEPINEPEEPSYNIVTTPRSKGVRYSAEHNVPLLSTPRTKISRGRSSSGRPSTSPRALVQAGPKSACPYHMFLEEIKSPRFWIYTGFFSVIIGLILFKKK